jgi:hypothetical protein
MRLARFTQRSRLPAKELGVPVHFLDVIIHSDSQAVTPFATTALKYISPSGRRHAFAKAVNANSATNFWLIGSFWHDFLLKQAPLLEARQAQNYTLSLFQSRYCQAIHFRDQSSLIAQYQ